MTNPNRFDAFAAMYDNGYGPKGGLVMPDPSWYLQRVFDLKVLEGSYHRYQSALEAFLPADEAPHPRDNESQIFSQLIRTSPVTRQAADACLHVLSTSIVSAQAGSRSRGLTWDQRLAKSRHPSGNLRFDAFIHVLTAALQRAGTNVLYISMVNDVVPVRGVLPQGFTTDLFNPKVDNPHRLHILRRAAQTLLYSSSWYHGRPLSGTDDYVRFADSVGMTAEQQDVLEQATRKYLASGKVGGAERMQDDADLRRAFFALLQAFTERYEPVRR